MWIFKRKNNEDIHPDALQENLLTSASSFLEVYSQRQDGLTRASDVLRQLTVHIREKKEEERKHKTTQAFLGPFAGAALGATFGAISGGAGGAVGTVIAVAFDDLCPDVNVGLAFVGGLLGGTVGGTSAGALGGGIGGAAEVAGYSIQCTVYEVAWAAVGCATGGVVGSIIGGTDGAVGGAVGGALGGFCGLIVALRFTADVTHNYKQTLKTRRQETQPAEINVAEVLQKTGQDFQENMEPLLEELNTIRTISKKMDCVGGVVRQSTKTLAALAKMEKVLREIQTTKEAKAMSWIEVAARQSTRIAEELEKMKAEVEKLFGFTEEMLTVNI